MTTSRVAPRLLGIAFLLQAVASLLSGVLLLQPLRVEDNVSESLIKIADHTAQMRAYVLGELVTAMGIVFLGVVLYIILKRHGERIALVALGLYILEAALLAVSRIAGFVLLRISEEYVAAGQPADLETLGSVALDALDYGYTLHMLPFCVGAALFYMLVYRSGIVPRALALWGLIALLPVLVAILFTLFGYDVPIFVYLPYAPFEFVIGAWILINGIREETT